MEKMMTVPDYYEQFHCLGADCKYTCCQEWTITLTKNDYMKMRNLKPSQAMQEKIEKGIKRIKKNSTDDIYAEIIYDENQLCPFLEKGLCSLQIECGYNILSKICKSFPRITSEIEVPQKSFSTGCEHVIEILSKLDTPLTFHEIPQDGDEFYKRTDMCHQIAFAERPIFRYAVKIQDLAIAILQNRSYSLDNRMILLGIFLKGLNELEQEKKFDEIPEFIKQKSQLAIGNDMQKSLDNLKTNSQLAIFNNINTSTLYNKNGSLSTKAVFKDIYDNLGITFENNENVQYVYAKYDKAVEHFKETNYEILFENIIVNNLFTFALPFTTKTIWDAYTFLASFYSLMKFMVIGYMTPDKTQDDLIHMLTILSRYQFHSDRNLFPKNFKANKSDTLAHMVIMIKG